MSKVKDGDIVKVHYTGRLNDGSVFDTSKEREPMEFKVGGSQVIPAFEQAVIGLEPGESTSVDIPANEAYGPYKNELVREIPRSSLPEDLDPEVGQRLDVVQESGQRIRVLVSEVKDTSVKIDANHPLAGKDLSFEIDLLEVK